MMQGTCTQQHNERRVPAEAVAVEENNYPRQKAPDDKQLGRITFQQFQMAQSARGTMWRSIEPPQAYCSGQDRQQAPKNCKVCGKATCTFYNVAKRQVNKLFPNGMMIFLWYMQR
jgi:hypothetical protein